MAILETEITFGIVLYKEELSKSITFRSLVKSIELCKGSNSTKEVTLFVYDNSPKDFNNKVNNVYKFSENIIVYYFTENKNKGLPFAYNFFGKEAEKLSKKWLVLLDQDTELPNDFYSKYLEIDPAIKLHCPHVYSNGNLMSPSMYKSFRSYSLEIPITNKISLNEISCINSGLMINVDLFQKVEGYNQKLFLDFCDHDFIYKIKSKINVIGIIDCQLTQEFSAVSNTKEQAKFRYNIFVKDLKAFCVGKNTLKIFLRVDLPRLLKLTYQYKSLDFFKIRFS